jgi:hypothetical protein
MPLDLFTLINVSLSKKGLKRKIALKVSSAASKQKK